MWSWSCAIVEVGVKNVQKFARTDRANHPRHRRHHCSTTCRSIGCDCCFGKKFCNRKQRCCVPRSGPMNDPTQTVCAMDDQNDGLRDAKAARGKRGSSSQTGSAKPIPRIVRKKMHAKGRGRRRRWKKAKTHRQNGTSDALDERKALGDRDVNTVMTNDRSSTIVEALSRAIPQVSHGDLIRSVRVSDHSVVASVASRLTSCQGVDSRIFCQSDCTP